MSGNKRNKEIGKDVNKWLKYLGWLNIKFDNPFKEFFKKGKRSKFEQEFTDELHEYKKITNKIKPKKLVDELNHSVLNLLGIADKYYRLYM